MSNQSITQDQWQSVVDAAQKHVHDQNLPDERLYINFREKFFGSMEAVGYRESILDNYDEFSVPSLHFDYNMLTKTGKISVYDNSEQASAPISLEQALDIASKMYSKDGNITAQDIVYHYVDQKTASLYIL